MALPSRHLLAVVPAYNEAGSVANVVPRCTSGRREFDVDRDR